MAITTPTGDDHHVLSAIIYAEATVEKGAAAPTTEMLAIGWTMRNRYLHVQTHAFDRKWWGKGTNYKTIAEANDGKEFVSVKGDRYKTFLGNLASITDAGEVAQGNLCVTAARQVLDGIAPDQPGLTGTYPYVWFKQGSSQPSARATTDPVKHASHWFWCFAPGRAKG